jgi:hypothetical protein
VTLSCIWPYLTLTACTYLHAHMLHRRHERDRPSKQEEIKKAMDEMPKKIEEWRETKRSKKKQMTELQKLLAAAKVSYSK